MGQHPRYVSSLTITAILLLSSCCNVMVSGSATTSVTTTSTTITTTTTKPPTTTSTPNKPNPIVQLGGYVRDSFVRLKDGTGQLYTNHKLCNDIRSRQKISLAESERRGISYYEFDFLQKGKEDRNKVGNLVFLMIFSPNFLPYSFMFFPNMLPSPFVVNAKDAREELEAMARVRAHTVIKTLMDIEGQKSGDNAGGFMSKINPFGKGAARRAMEKMVTVYDSSTGFLTTEDNNGGGETVLNALNGAIYTTEKPTKEQARLANVPKPIVKGLSTVLEGTSSSFNILPHFITRGKVLTQIQKVTEADEFLASENIDLGTIHGKLLQEACSRRLIGTSGSSEDELRETLVRWIDLTVVKPRSMEETNTEGLEKQEKGIVVTKGGEDEGRRYYNGNLARVALMCYNAVSGVRDERCSSTLPRMLYVGGNK